MARLQRVVLSGYPLHIMVRGHNSKDIFISDEEKKSYLEWLKDAAREYALAIHAYALMPNHVHILATPKTILSASKVMQSIGRRYAQLFNQTHGSSGTVWEGRFKSCLIDPDAYFLLVQKYIEQRFSRQSIRQPSWNLNIQIFSSSLLSKNFFKFINQIFIFQFKIIQ
jgi:putative transposase